MPAPDAAFSIERAFRRWGQAFLRRDGAKAYIYGSFYVLSPEKYRGRLSFAFSTTPIKIRRGVVTQRPSNGYETDDRGFCIANDNASLISRQGRPGNPGDIVAVADQ